MCETLSRVRIRIVIKMQSRIRIRFRFKSIPTHNTIHNDRNIPKRKPTNIIPYELTNLPTKQDIKKMYLQLQVAGWRMVCPKVVG
jgi:hypothetical protein